VYNNSIYTENYQNSIEYRFSATHGVEIINNLTNKFIVSRDGGTSSLLDNFTHALENWFVDATGGDLHLVSKIPVVVDQAGSLSGVSDDFDGDARPIGLAPDIGADEYGDPPPAAVTDLRVTQALTDTGTLTVTLDWSPPKEAESQTIRYASERITASNWEAASILNDSLAGSASSYNATIPYDSETLYFVQRGYNTTGGWSALSNNAFWPHYDTFLPYTSINSSTNPEK
jgi:hypothetical protein